MTGCAADALVDMNTVIEVYEIRQVVHAGPLQRLPAPETGAPRFQDGRVRPDLRVAAHANLSSRKSGDSGLLYRRMAVAAIDAVVGDVMLVAEGNGLFFDDLNIGDVGTPVHGVCEREQRPCSKDGSDETYLRNRVSASMENLSHES